MRFGAIFGGALVTIAIACAAPAAAATLPATHPVKARLVAEMGSVAPGGTLWVDLHLDIAQGWHVYWRNPGDSGLPTEIAWQLPAGFQAGDILWPAPERFVLGTIGNYGYQGSADLLVPITAPAILDPGGSAHLAANASWLVCSEICIPGEAALALDLPVSAAPGAAEPDMAPLFAEARRRLPQPARFAADFAVSGGQLRLTVPAAAFAGLDRPQASFFPFDANLVDAAAEPRQQQRGDGIELALQLLGGGAPQPAAKPGEALGGVLELRGTGGAERAYTITAARAAVPTGEGAAGIAWWQAMLLALLGGAALNLMPCVFPILSLKLLGLANSVHRAEERRHGLCYAAGVVLSFATLGGVLLVLREGGAAIGWGFQLQSPVVVGLLAYLLLAMGLSLSGVVEFGLGIGDLGGRLAGRAGLAGAFATGVLAAVVASPCTAPFMGVALGFALVAPAALALMVFIAIGVGLAAPIVLATAVPALARLLPRPGAWMGWFKQLMAFPLYVTVAWLVWVLLQETGPAGAFPALLGLVAVGFAVWIYGRTRAAAPIGRRVGSGLAAAGIVLSAILAPKLPPAEALLGGAPSDADGGLAYEAFSPGRLEQLEAVHQPAFVNLTAAWCLTCLFNERTVLDSEQVRHAFWAHHIVALKGDWTRRDPAIAGFLQQFGRSGVPLYLLYDKSGRPTVLPQILTEAELLAAVEKI